MGHCDEGLTWPTTHLPPVVASLLVDDEEALATLGEFKAAMAETAAQMDAATTGISNSAGGVSKDLETLGQDAAGAGAAVGAGMKGASDGAKDAEAEIESSATTIGEDLENIGASAAVGAAAVGEHMEATGESAKAASEDIKGAGSGIEDALSGVGDAAMLTQADVEKALADETPYEKAVRASENAEKDIESDGKGFSSRVSQMFESVGNSMGSFGLPFGNSVKKMGYSISEGEEATGGFASSLASVGKVAVGVGLLIGAAIGVAALKSADEFDKANEQLKTAMDDTGNSMKANEPELTKMYKSYANLGFNSTEVAGSMAKLVTSTKSVGLSQRESGIAADLARAKNIGLSEATETLVKVNAGSNRGLIQLGLNLNIGSAKLSSQQTATEGVTKAKTALKAAEENMAQAEAKGAEEHKAAVEKVKSAQEALAQAQQTLKSDSEGLQTAQQNLKEAQKGVGEAAKKEKEELLSAQRAYKSSTEGLAKSQRELKEAQRGVRETAEQEAEAVKHAQQTLTGAEENATEAAQNGANSVQGAQINLKKVQNEVNEKKLTGVEASLALQAAELQLTEAQERSSDSQTKASHEVTKAHEELSKAQKEDSPTSQASIAAANKLVSAQEGVKQAELSVKEATESLHKAQRALAADSPANVAAAKRVEEAQRGVSSAEEKLKSDQQAVGKATRELSTDQAAAAGTSEAVAKASRALKTAHENLGRAEEKLSRDTHTTSEVLKALESHLGGEALNATKMFGGQVDVVKANIHNLATELGEKLMPTLMKLAPVFEKIALATIPIVQAITMVVEKEVNGWRMIGEVMGRFYYGTVEPVAAKIVHVLEDLANPVIKVVGFFVGMGVKIDNVLIGIVKGMVNFGKDIVEAIVEGIESAPGVVTKAIENLIPGGGVVGSAIHAIGLASGGIVRNRRWPLWARVAQRLSSR